MMQKVLFLQKKIPQGKMLQLEREGDNLKITGDFFCYPEETIEKMEKILCSRKKDQEKIISLKDLCHDPAVTLSGFSPEDLWEMYEEIRGL